MEILNCFFILIIALMLYSVVPSRIPHVTFDVDHSRIGKMNLKSLVGKSVPFIILGKTG